jgi:hypothetical protein
MFTKYTLDLEANIFESLLKSVDFEDITKGRKSANLVDIKDELIPLVRTTTQYQKPNQPFTNIHYDLINNIKQVTENKDLKFNNAMIELYSYEYYKMGFHTDQSLDLDDKSFICVFSCYNDPNTKSLRKLVIKNKVTKQTHSIMMEHNSIILFSVATNKQHVHKIVLELSSSKNLWLGITFRFSKTIIQFINEIPYFSNKQILTLTNKDQLNEFRKYKRAENDNVDFVYPEINYTLSPGDLIPL